ncbi:MAG TPA: acyl-CoA dehydrogenase [Polyangiales bacterium]|nr:acyl-CoA dehydrogenase [Polyangiales bacterium]
MATDLSRGVGVFSFDLPEELTLLQSTARSFARDALLPKLRSAEAARAVDGDARAAYAQIGLADLELPSELGGASYGALARVLVNEELAAADAGAALALDRVGPALYALLELGGLDALRSVLELPEARALLVTSREAALQLSGDTLNGRVPYVPAEQAQLLVVLASDHALVVREGLAFERVRGAGLRAAGGAELRLDGSKVAARLELRDDPLAASRALARARLYLAALLLGVLRHADEYARAYALEREAFGRKIAHHQALAFLLVDMHAAVDGARLLIHDAALRADRGEPFAAVAASALVEVIEVARWVGPAAVQVLGGHGFMQDHPVEKLMREARALGLLLGGIDAARDDAGAALCGLALRVQLSLQEGA